MQTYLRTLTSGLLLAAVAQTASALVIVDRGLPTSDLNDAAGPDRTNIAWSAPQTPTDAWMLGDQFNVGNPFAGNPVQITKVTLWAVGTQTDDLVGFDYADPASYQLYLRSSNLGLAFIDAITTDISVAVTPVTYSGGDSFQRVGTSTVDQLYQVDFTLTVPYTVPVNARVRFALGGFVGGNFVNPFLHATRSVDSGGNVQPGYDEVLYSYAAPNTDVSYFDFQYTESSDSAAFLPAVGWTSDFNVRVEAIPEPSAAGVLAGVAALAVLWFRRRKA